MTADEPDISPQLRVFLRRVGISARQLAKSKRDTRLWHDLGEYGEEAEIILEAFCTEFSVDYTQFEFSKYFPAKNVSDSLALSIMASFVPYLEHFIRTRRRYAPFSLGMLDDAIISKKLV